MNESDGNAVVCVNITEGTLDPGEVVVVMVSTMDNTTGKLLKDVQFSSHYILYHFIL